MINSITNTYSLIIGTAHTFNLSKFYWTIIEYLYRFRMYRKVVKFILIYEAGIANILLYTSL